MGRFEPRLELALRVALLPSWPLHLDSVADAVLHGEYVGTANLAESHETPLTLVLADHRAGIITPVTYAFVGQPFEDCFLNLTLFRAKEPKGAKGAKSQRDSLTRLLGAKGAKSQRDSLTRLLS